MYFAIFFPYIEASPTKTNVYRQPHVILKVANILALTKCYAIKGPMWASGDTWWCHIVQEQLVGVGVGVGVGGVGGGGWGRGVGWGWGWGWGWGCWGRGRTLNGKKIFRVTQLWYPVETLKTGFNVASEYQGCPTEDFFRFCEGPCFFLVISGFVFVLWQLWHAMTSVWRLHNRC